MLDALIQWDQELFLWLNNQHNAFLDELMWWISYNFTWVPFYLFLIIVVGRRYGWKILAILVPTLVMLVLCADQSSVQLFKEVFQRPRPCHEPALEGMVHIVKDHCGGKWGFVSSHATNSFAVAVFILSLLKHRFWMVLMLVWAAVVSYSRVYLGVHYPGDILGGALLGSFWGWFWAKPFFYFTHRFKSALALKGV